MMDLPKRKSSRISGYDYSTPNYYFITICTDEKKCIFGKPGELNPNGMIAEDCLLKIAEINPRIQIEKYVVMPNHIHAIFVVSTEKEEESSADLSVAIGQYKMAVTKRIREKHPGKKVWQRSFHDHIIRNQKSYEKIWLYIEDNPRKWEEDCFFCNESKLLDFGRVSDPPLQEG